MSYGIHLVATILGLATVPQPVQLSASLIIMDIIQDHDHWHPSSSGQVLKLERIMAEFQELCRRAFWEGAKAARQGIREDQNPYPQYSGGAYFWQIGYTALE